MRHLKKYITNPKQSFTRKAHKIKERAELKQNFIRAKNNADYTTKSIALSWEGKPKRYDLINAVIKQQGYKNYLEIGCFKNVCFNKIECAKKTGVDPDIGGTVRMTSDEFFAQNKEKFDCIFIDGLHEYAQVKKDIENAIECLAEGGTILLDDCLPLKYEYQTVPASDLIWNGDVWKAVVEARTWDNVETAVTLIDHGIGLIKKRANSNKPQLISRDFFRLKFEDFVNNYEKWLNTISYEKALEFVK